MAFVSANCTRYDLQTVGNSSTGAPVRFLTIGGFITDDASPDPLYAECVIEQDVLDTLPPADPELDGTPYDARFQAIQSIVAQFVARTHAAWVGRGSLAPAVESKPPELLAMLPPLTTLPEVSGGSVAA